MKAYVLTEPSRIEIQDREIPTIGSDEVLIKVTHVGICGSDIHLYKGSYNGPFKYPMLFGHEWSGIVHGVGSNVSDLEVGDNVTGDCSRFCGYCSNCQQDKNLCVEIEKYGITVDGASAEYIVRPRKHVYKASKKINRELLALAEPVAVAKHLIEKIRISAGEMINKKILIYGGGAIGQASLLLLTKHYGCSNVDISDLEDYRIKLAQEFGGKFATQQDLTWSYPNDYPSMYNDTKYDIIIETTGVSAVFNNSIALLKPGGTLGCVGMIGQTEIAQKLIVAKALAIVGSIGGTGEFGEVIDFIEKNPEDLSKLVSHTFNVIKTSEAFSAAEDASSAMKVILSFE